MSTAAPAKEPGPSGQADRNRSLERGMEILRAFRAGTDLLGNGELAERSGLPRATVTRLTQTLVGAGFLERDRCQRAFRLGATVLSLAHALRSTSPVLRIAGPMLQREAEKRQINVGLAVADRDEMLYLESFRYSRKVAWRTVVAGQRIPMELTSLGRAWLATAPDAVREALIQRFIGRRATGGKALERELRASIASVRKLGYCCVSWQPKVVALATPIVVVDHPVHVLNMSVNTDDSQGNVERNLAGALLDLRSRLNSALGML